MAGFASVSVDIRTGFNAAWAASAYSAVPVYWDGDPIATTQPDADDEFLRISILESSAAFTQEIDTRNSEILGVVVAQVFSEAGIGDARNRALCDGVRDALQRNRYGDARLQISRRDPVGVLESQRHYQANVTTPFRFINTPS